MRKFFLGFFFVIFCSLGALAQTVITGRVTDGEGKGLAGASVTIQGQTAGGTSTANDGTYRISVPAGAKALVFSYLSTKVTENISGRTSIDVVLKQTASTMDEVVVTGINRVRRSQYAGAATKIKEEDIRDKPFGSLDQALQGLAPGLVVLTGSGQPGTSAVTIIRGQGSIEGGTSPLYIVDGVPMESGVFQGLNPNDFASIDILRDATATALYGSRASAGVIVVTTRRGTTGKLKISYSGQFGVKSKPDFAFRPMNTTELFAAQEKYGQVTQDNYNTNMPGWYYSTANPRYATLTPDEQMAQKAIYDSLKGINTNWYDQVFRNGNFSNHSISLRGGTEKARFSNSLSLYNEEGTTLRTDMRRVTNLTTLDFSDDRWTFNSTLNLGYTRRNFQQSTAGNNLGNPFLIAAVNVPFVKARNADGSVAVGPTGSPFFSAPNTIDVTNRDVNSNNQFLGVLSNTINYKISSAFTAGVTAGIDFRETQNTAYGAKDAWIRINSSSITGKAGFQSEGLNRFVIGNVRPNVTFHKKFQEKHDLEVAAYGEYLVNVGKSFNFTGYGTNPKTPNTPAAVTQGNAQNQLYSTVGGGRSRAALISGLLTAKYVYKDKYTLSGSIRNDHASKLPSANRSDWFYAIGGVWDVKKESFMDNSDLFSVLRVKASYGSSGNFDNFPFNNWQSEFVQGAGPSGATIAYQAAPSNPDLRWEKTFVTNIGIDYGVWRGRIYGDINLYDKKTKDLFIQRNLSAVSGFGSIYQNLGVLDNRGIEVALNVDVVKKNNFIWTIFANYAYNKNRVKSLGGEPAYEAGTELITEGKPLGTHYEVKWAGVDAATGQPLYYDQNGNLTNTYSTDYRVQEFGTWEAPTKGSFGTRLSYKGIDLSALFTFQQGSTKVDNMEYFTENPVGFMANGYNQSSDLNFWTKPGDIASTPSPNYGTNFSSKIIHDASFLRFRDLTLGYTIPTGTLAKTKIISNARVYVQGTNLAIWTHWRGLDPEAGAVNINLSEFPNPRAITAGLQITF
jgi:TonB-linked SusC/RagA family outer membrane protein